MTKKRRRERRASRPDFSVTNATPEPGTPDSTSKFDRASNYLLPFDKIPPGTNCGLICRVSTDNQETKKQAAKLRAKALAKGCKVPYTFRYVGRGDVHDHEYVSFLRKAEKWAKKNNAALLAESTDRFLRCYDGGKITKPGAAEFQELRRICDDVTLVTMCHPDATSGEQHSAHIKRGLSKKVQTKPGDTKRQKEIMLSKVFWFTIAGFSVRETADLLEKDPRQIQRWRDKLRDK